MSYNFIYLQQSIGRLSQEVETQNDDLHRMAAREANYHDKEGRLVEEIRGKTSLIIQLERALEDVKQEAHSHMQQTVSRLSEAGLCPRWVTVDGSAQYFDTPLTTTVKTACHCKADYFVYKNMSVV